MRLHLRRKVALLLFAITAVGCNMPSTRFTMPGYTGQPSPSAKESLGNLPTPTTSSPTETPVVTPTPSLLTADLLTVVFLEDGQPLNLYSAPGSENQVVSTLSSHGSGITHTENYQEVEGNLWLELNIPNGGTAWADTSYLTTQVSSEKFCADQRLNGLISQMVEAIQQRDEEKLASLTSPVHGLSIRHEWWNPELRIKSRDQMLKLFSDDTSYNWGIQDGSGLPLQGSFSQVVLPGLDDGLQGYTQFCNTLEQGLAAGFTTGFVKWPFEYQNFNYVSLYRAAPPGDELNWRTWSIGIEYIGEEPYVVVMVQYHWEI